MREIKPCPLTCREYIGMIGPYVEERKLGLFRGTSQFVRCLYCGVCGPSRFDRCEAIAAWNELPRKAEAEKAESKPDPWVVTPVSEQVHESPLHKTIVKVDRHSYRPTHRYGFGHSYDHKIITLTLKKTELGEVEFNALKSQLGVIS